MINSRTISFKNLYLAVGVLGSILPLLDVWKCGWHIPPSISESYYLGAIVPFTCVLFSLGVVFFFNKGFDIIDTLCNKLSGIAAIGVVSFPCDSPKFMFPVLHYVSAITLFLTFAFMSLFVFRRLRSPKGYTKNKNRRNIIYTLCGFSILLFMLLTGLKVITIYWGEVLMLESFAVSYIVQGEIIFKD